MTDEALQVISEADRVRQQIHDELWRQKLIEAAEAGLRKGCQSEPCIDFVHKADAIRAVDAILQSGLVKEQHQ